NSSKTRAVNCSEADRAWLAAGVDFSTAQIKSLKRWTRFANRHHFRVLGRIEHGRDVIPTATNGFVLTNDDRAERPAVVVMHARARERNGFVHPSLVRSRVGSGYL